MAEDSGAFKTNPAHSRPIGHFVMIPEASFRRNPVVPAGFAAAIFL
jgi:hypothetical protein